MQKTSAVKTRMKATIVTAIVATAVTMSIGAGNASAQIASVDFVTDANGSKQLVVETNVTSDVDDIVFFEDVLFGGATFPTVNLHLGVKGNPRTTPEKWTVEAPCRIMNPYPQRGTDEYVECPTRGLSTTVVRAGKGNDQIQNFTALAMVATGGDGSDRLYGGLGLDLLFGENGADTITDAGGDGRLFASFENLLDGGAGNDDILSQENTHTPDLEPIPNVTRDRIIGGPGNDKLRSGSDRDLIEARDGQKDTVDCGDDFDQVRRDPVESSVRNCEQMLP